MHRCTKNITLAILKLSIFSLRGAILALCIIRICMAVFKHVCIIGVGNTKEQCQIKDHNNVMVYVLLEYYTTELLNECQLITILSLLLLHKLTPTAETHTQTHTHTQTQTQTHACTHRETHTHIRTYICIRSVYTIYTKIFEGVIFCEGKSERIFAVYFMADHQVEYIVFLSHCFFFMRIKFRA